MFEADMVKDAEFLHKVDRDPNRVVSVRVLVLNVREDILSNLEGRVLSGNLTLNGNSAVRRTGSITFVASEEFNDIANIDNLLTVDKRIKLYIGLENHIENYIEGNRKCDIGDIIWFNQGVFVVTQPNITHDINSVKVSLQFKDKMALLNGECGGTLPAAVQFDSYEQRMSIRRVQKLPDVDPEPSPYYYYEIKRGDLLMTWGTANGYTWSKSGEVYPDWKSFEDATFEDLLYFRYDTETGWEVLDARPAVEEDGEDSYYLVKQRIRDIIISMVANYGGQDISKIIVNDVPTYLPQIVTYTGSDELWYNPNTKVYSYITPDPDVIGNYIKFEYGDEIGRAYTELTYPGSLVTSYGDTVVTVLDKIKNALGNCEYFYDVNGNFVFQEKKNYLNSQYDPVTRESIENSDSLLNIYNCSVDFSNTSYNIYDFEDNCELISNYTKQEDFQKIKNDYHIWGKNNSGGVLHYHVAIKDKPVVDPTPIKIVVLQEIVQEDGRYIARPSGKIRIANDEDSAILKREEMEQLEELTVSEDIKDISLKIKIEEYIPQNWREMVYISGLNKQNSQQRPDLYEQEMLDWFDSIYNMYEHKFKDDEFRRTDFKYWVDYIEPSGVLSGISVDAIGIRSYTAQSDDVKRMFEADVPNNILISDGWVTQKTDYCKKLSRIQGREFSNIPAALYDEIAFSQSAGTAMTYARESMYELIQKNDSINFSGVPIYYLEPNRRITVTDSASGIGGDYVINSITIPLDPKGQMSVSASKAMTRI